MVQLEYNVPILESLRPTFQRALEELPKTWWNLYASDFLNSEEYQKPIRDLSYLVYTSREGFRLDHPKDYSFIIFHPEDIKNSLLRGVVNGFTIPMLLLTSPVISTCIYPQIYCWKKMAKLTFEEDNRSLVIEQIKFLENKIKQYSEPNKKQPLYIQTSQSSTRKSLC